MYSKYYVLQQDASVSWMICCYSYKVDVSNHGIVSLLKACHMFYVTRGWFHEIYSHLTEKKKLCFNLEN